MVNVGRYCVRDPAGSSFACSIPANAATLQLTVDQIGSSPKFESNLFPSPSRSIVFDGFGDVANHEVQLGLSLGNAGKHAIS